MLVGSDVEGGIIQDKGDRPSSHPQNKHLKPSNAFKDYGWFFTRNNKHVLLKITTYPWMENKVWCSKASSKEKIIQKFANEYGYLGNEGAKLWIDGNMKFFRCKTIHFVNAEDHVKYKYVQRSIGINHDE